MTRNLTTSLFVKLLVQTQKSDWTITDSYVCSIAGFHINVLYCVTTIHSLHAWIILDLVFDYYFFTSSYGLSLYYIMSV